MWKKKIKWLVWMGIISAFPFYFKSVSKSYDWITTDTGGQAGLGAATILIIGFCGYWLTEEIFKDEQGRFR
jgi:hypothetical protein